MADKQFAVIQKIMADQFSEKFPRAFFDVRLLPLQFSQRQFKTVRDLYFLDLKMAGQFVVMVAGHAQGVSIPNHVHHQFQDSHVRRAAIAKIAQEDGRPAWRRYCRKFGLVYRITKFLQQ